MCGRSRQTVAPESLASAVGFSANVPLRRASQYRRRENACPGSATPIAYKTSTGGNALRSMRWGLVPSFTKRGERPDFFRMFNARSETAAEKPSFRGLVGRRHGVVAFTGFYEWKRDDKGERQPYYFHFADNRPMLFAVLYDTWKHGGGFVVRNDGDDNHGSGPGSTNDGGESEKAAAAAAAAKSTSTSAAMSSPTKSTKSGAHEQEERRKQATLKLQEVEDQGQSIMFSYAVLTTSAAPRLTWLHERMPIILRGAQDAAAWLTCKGAEASTFLKNHVPYSEEDLVWHPVSKKMNAMGYEGDDCSAAVKLKKPNPRLTRFFEKIDREPPPPTTTVLPSSCSAVPAVKDVANTGGDSVKGRGRGSSGAEKRGIDDVEIARCAADLTESVATNSPISSPSSSPGRKAKRSRTQSSGGGSGGNDDREEVRETGGEVASPSTSAVGAAAAAAAAVTTIDLSEPDAFSPLQAAAAAGGSRTVTFSSGSNRMFKPRIPGSPGKAGNPSPRKSPRRPKPGSIAAAAAKKDTSQCKLTSFFQKLPG